MRFQSTHSLRSATRLPGIGAAAKPVSIHALLAECDGGAPDGRRKNTGFNPRTPCGVRHWPPASTRKTTGFNPRTPCGVRRLRTLPTSRRLWFQSTHSLRSATHPLTVMMHYILFQSTHSLRSATFRPVPQTNADSVSIHALLAECDFLFRPEALCWRRFNPRTPCGVRRFAV